MGDNRLVSRDSRNGLGYWDETKVLGEVHGDILLTLNM